MAIRPQYRQLFEFLQPPTILCSERAGRCSAATLQTSIALADDTPWNAPKLAAKNLFTALSFALDPVAWLAREPGTFQPPSRSVVAAIRMYELCTHLSDTGFQQRSSRRFWRPNNSKDALSEAAGNVSDSGYRQKSSLLFANSDTHTR